MSAVYDSKVRSVRKHVGGPVGTNLSFAKVGWYECLQWSTLGKEYPARMPERNFFWFFFWLQKKNREKALLNA